MLKSIAINIAKTILIMTTRAKWFVISRHSGRKSLQYIENSDKILYSYVIFFTPKDNKNL